jgi:hypothetical protein
MGTLAGCLDANTNTPESLHRANEERISSGAVLRQACNVMIVLCIYREHYKRTSKPSPLNYFIPNSIKRLSPRPGLNPISKEPRKPQT